MTAVVEWGLILEVIWTSLVAAIGVTILFSIVVYASSRAAEARRVGGSPAPFGVLAVAAMAAFLGAVVVGLLVILNK